MTAIAPIQTAQLQSQNSVDGASSAASRLSGHSKDSKGDVKSNFQDFAAGTFYKEMLKSLRKMHGKPAYLDGGQAEKIFEGQLDQQVAEDLAHSHGGQFSDGLYQAFLHRTGSLHATA
jgi:Rod binding domain-containing protein